VSYVITIHNHRFLIEQILRGINSSATLPFEIIIIDDASNDFPLNSLKKFINEFELSEYLSRIFMYRNLRQRFEVFSDNFGCNQASGLYLCLIQGDMVVNDPGFDTRLKKLLDNHQDVGAISGKSVRVSGANSIKKWENSKGHAFKLPTLTRYLVNYFKKSSKDLNSNQKNFFKYSSLNETYCRVEECNTAEELTSKFIKYGEVHYKDTSKGIDQQILNSNILMIGRLINRGPIFMKVSDFKSVNGFNIKAFFQGWDDFEFSTKLIVQGKALAFSPINFESRPDWGATQRKKSLYLILLIRFNRFKIKKFRKHLYISRYDSLNLDHPLVGKVFRN
jgi:GT2 family glycosyltransferase